MKALEVTGWACLNFLVLLPAGHAVAGEEAALSFNLDLTGSTALLPSNDEDPAPEIEITPWQFELRSPEDGSWFDAVMLGALADEPANAPPADAANGGKGDLAEQATNPVAPIVQFQLQNTFTPESYATDGYANSFVVQPVIPVAPIGSFPRSIWRPTIPIVTTPDQDNGTSGTTGLGDISLLGGPVFDFDWGFVVVGPAITIPSATDARLGARQWELGPVVGPIITSVPKTQFGALLFNKWGLGGAGEQYTNSFYMQPILNLHLEDGWYHGLSDYIWSHNWETDDTYIPLSWRVGRVFAIGEQQVNIAVSPYYNVGDDVPGQGQWGVKLSVTLLFPQ